MKLFEDQITIDAPAEEIWAALIDTARWPEFDPFCDGIEGQPALGNRVKIKTKLAPGRVFKVKVTQFDAPRVMAWADGMPFGLFKGVRTYEIVPQADGGCLFSMREAFSGPMLPMIAKHLPDMSEAFTAFCAGLKSHVESGKT